VSADGPHGPYRILAPKDVLSLNPTDPLSTYWDKYIHEVYGSQYTKSDLKINVVNPEGGAAIPYVGRVMSSNGKTFIHFVRQDGGSVEPTIDQYSPLTPPSWVDQRESASKMVFANDGVFADAFQRKLQPGGVAFNIVNNLENQLVSAINRGIALNNSSTWGDVATFYKQGNTYNLYAAFWHQPTISIDGRAYAFPYDDQGGNSTDLSVDSPTQVSIAFHWD
jgi:hypothetical protein